MSQTDLFAILPVAALLVWAMLLLLVDLAVPKERKGTTAALAAVGLALAVGLTLTQIGRNSVAFTGMLVVDGFAIFLNVLFLASGLLAVALASDYLKRLEIERGEYYPLLLFSICGMMLMAQAGDLIVVFLALELLSIPLYILAGISRPKPESEEASLKYFLLGSFASGFVLYGVSLVFGATRHTDLQGIVESIRQVGQATASSTGSLLPDQSLFSIGAALLLIGFGFKVAAVPFHMWTPDVYHGAPSSVTGFMSVGAKAAGFAALLRVFVLAFPSLVVVLTPVAWSVAALTMLVGNVLAITQNNIKRLLAYSSIAHAGYILMGFVPFGNGEVVGESVASALVYLASYAAASFAAWAVVIAVEQPDGRGLNISDFAGLGRSRPLLAAVMAVAMLSFTGIPPFIGFWGKFYLFRAALEGGYVSLALIGLLTSLISAYYYLRVIVVMYMQEGNPGASRELWINVAASLSALAVILMGLLPGWLFNLSGQAALVQWF